MRDRTLKAASNFRSFGANLVAYLFGTAAMQVVGIITTFLIPKYLSIDEYGLWQIFLLYSAYVGLLQLGFAEGALLLWARDKLGRYSGELRMALKYLVLEQVAIIIPLSLIMYFALGQLYKWMFILLMAFALVLNLTSVLVNAAQAARRFRSLSVVLTSRALIFLVFVVILIAANYMNYLFLTACSVISWLIILFIFILIFRRDIWVRQGSTSSLWDYGKRTTNVGIFIMLGNSVVVFFLTIDRLMASSLLPIGQFAIYAFASTVVAFCYYFVKAIAEVLFPYISVAAPEARDKIYQLAKSAIILVWAFVLLAYFPLTKLVEFYLPDYSASLPIVAFLLCAVGFCSLIQIIHVNYYKIHNKQRTYFIVGLVALLVSILLILLALKVFATLQSISVAMLCSAGLWYIINEFCLKSIAKGSNKNIIKSIAIILGYSIIFLIISMLPMNFLIMMLICILLFSVLSWIFLRNDIKELAYIIINRKGMLNQVSEVNGRER